MTSKASGSIAVAVPISNYGVGKDSIRGLVILSLARRMTGDGTIALWILVAEYEWCNSVVVHHASRGGRGAMTGVASGRSRLPG